MDVRRAFVAGARSVVTLVASPRLDERWTSPSVLAEFAVSGLTGHLVRAVTVTTEIIERAEPDGEPVDVATFFAAATATWPDRAVGIRQRGEAGAVGGPAAVRAALATGVDELERVLTAQRPDRRVLRQDDVLTLDDFLLARAVELLVHADDLAASLAVDVPAFEPGLVRRVIALLVDTAVARHGDLAVLVALTRRERDTVDALRVV